MPLKSGYSQKTVGKNIKEMMHADKKRPHKQMVAIAFSEARKSAKKAGKSPTYLFKHI